MEPVKVVDIISKVDLNRDGVLAAASSRKLDKGGYHLQDPVAIVHDNQFPERFLENPSVLEFLDKELEELRKVRVLSLPSPWTSSEGQALDAWLLANKVGRVDFFGDLFGIGPSFG